MRDRDWYASWAHSKHQYNARLRAAGVESVRASQDHRRFPVLHVGNEHVRRERTVSNDRKEMFAVLQGEIAADQQDHGSVGNLTRSCAWRLVTR